MKMNRTVKTILISTGLGAIITWLIGSFITLDFGWFLIHEFNAGRAGLTAVFFMLSFFIAVIYEEHFQ